ncbi:MAG TPA: hypothetical protein VK730_11040 [Solirubrobacteraceae bacterium]|jgi:hypothetical protein|nr:hypothetical protein [Solirubrobacteraceae bacterium]
MSEWNPHVADEPQEGGVTFPPVLPLPSTPEELPTAIEGWARSPALTALVEAFGDRLPDDLELDALLTWLEAYSERWDFRSGRERNLVEVPQLTSAAERIVSASALALGLRSAPASSPLGDGPEGAGGRYDDVLVLGGLVRACLARPLHAAKLLREGNIETKTVTALGGFRVIAGDEVGLVERVVGEQASDEFHAMDAGLRNAFAVAEPVSDCGDDSNVVGASWRVREYATVTGLPIRVVAAPSSEPGVRRANTADTYAWFATELARLHRGQRVLIVTTEIYVPYQHADALRMLALPYGVEVDVTGVDPGRAHPELQQAFDTHHYLQEVRSTIRALHALHAALASTAAGEPARSPVRQRP